MGIDTQDFIANSCLILDYGYSIRASQVLNSFHIKKPASTIQNRPVNAEKISRGKARGKKAF
jgi:hypothetical protein